jgi:transcriptional regulator with XRE-family HTH domain
MTGEELKEARERKGFTQQQAARRLGVTQAYFSMMESGRRVLPTRLARRAVAVLGASPAALPLRVESLVESFDSDAVRKELAALGYPGFAYLGGKARHNPAEVLANALKEADLDSRVVEGLPWLAARYADMDWDWLVQRAKLSDLQNRLGFVTTMAVQLAANAADTVRARKLEEYAAVLDRSRLVKEDTLCHDGMTQAERNWLRTNRPDEAKHWNLLTDMKAENLTHGQL